jgi:hypothetical protein
MRVRTKSSCDTAAAYDNDKRQEVFPRPIHQPGLLSSRTIRLTPCMDLPLSSPHSSAAHKYPRCPSRSKRMEKKSLRRAAGNKQRSAHERWPKEPASPNCVTAIFEDFSACEADSNSSVSPFDHHDPLKNPSKAGTSASPAGSNRREIAGLS